VSALLPSPFLNVERRRRLERCEVPAKPNDLNALQKLLFYLASSRFPFHGKIARQRHDFYHKLSAALIGRFAFLASEELSPANMSKAPKPKPDPENPGAFLPNGAARKAGLNRSILDAAGSKLLGMLRTKAAEAASVFALANTRAVKPTQRCHRCGALVAKDLSQREHRCACGCVCGRDENAAKTLLRWLCEGNFWSGTGQGASMPPETLSTALCAW
jgi:putative transposase